MQGRPRLEGLGCLIVGGTSGIGLAAARRFLNEGARVLVAGRTEDSARTALDLLEPLGEVWISVSDASDEASVDALFETARDTLGGRLDVLFHVAGISGRKFGDGPLHECDSTAWDHVLDQNARSVFLTNRAAVRQMRRQSLDAAGIRGTVLNTGSVLAFSPSPKYFGTFAYAASKGAIESMTRLAASQYAPEKIRFNLITPSLIETPMSARAVSDPTIRAFLQTKQPMGEGPGAPDDCAEAALFLCEPTSRFITGATLTVDGGWTVSDGQWPAH